MKKIVIALIVCCTGFAIIPTDATSLEWNTHHWGANNQCLLYMGNLVRVKRFWWCGTQRDYCLGKYSGYHSVMKHGEYVLSQQYEEKGDTYYCCIDKDTGTEQFKKSDTGAWIVKTETITEDLDNGTKCQWTRTTDVCGKTYGTKCNKPDPKLCDEGTIFRNGACVAYCDDGKVFESATSNKCVECPQGARQGINNKNQCIKCAESELFNAKTRECISKSDTKVTTISKDAMQQCWRCPDTNSAYKKCVYALHQGTAMPADVKTACGLDKDK